MTHSFKNKTDVAQFVNEEIQALKGDSALTMIIRADTSGAYSVSSVTDMSSEDTVRLLGQCYLGQLQNI
jgi:hypothetical protein